jgi:hypothetical protein
MDIDARSSFSSITSFDDGTDDLVVDSWSSRFAEPDGGWKERLNEELQPVVESLGRLRDRDLLD